MPLDLSGTQGPEKREVTVRRPSVGAITTAERVPPPRCTRVITLVLGLGFVPLTRESEGGGTMPINGIFRPSTCRWLSGVGP